MFLFKIHSKSNYSVSHLKYPYPLENEHSCSFTLTPCALFHSEQFIFQIGIIARVA